LLLTLVGCQSRLYQYTDPTYGVSISYPGTVDLISDPEVLEQLAGAELETAVDHPRLLFAMVTPQESRLSCTLHQIPEGFDLTPQEYYQASTAQELDRLQATVTEPLVDLTIGGREFQRVGFETKVDETIRLHVRIYQHVDSKTRRVLVLTPMAETSDWEQEAPLLESVIESVRISW
jgi:hypothetical protein